MQALAGFALMRDGRAIGYCYYVCEEGKGLIGDLCVMAAHRTQENENTLLEASLNAMFGTLGIRRVEAQIMMISSPLQRHRAVGELVSLLSSLFHADSPRPRGPPA